LVFSVTLDVAANPEARRNDGRSWIRQARELGGGKDDREILSFMKTQVRRFSKGTPHRAFHLNKLAISISAINAKYFYLESI